MTIKRRLIVSYLAMLIVPFILIMLTAGIFRFLSTYNNENTLDPFSNSSYSHKPLSNYYVLSKLNMIAVNSPELLFSDTYMSALESEFDLSGYIVVIKDDVIMYKSSKISSKNIWDAIARQNFVSYGNFNKQMKPEVMLRWEFSIPNQNNGVFYYIIDPKQMFSEYFSMGLIFILIVAIVLIITNGTLTYMVSRSIIKPLGELEKAATKIKDGNLDNPINYKKNDEMKDVFSSFDEMRKRLKNSLEKQLSYEENRKELIASISHDLKTPLTVLKGYAEGLKDGVANTEEKKNHYLNTIHQKANQMDHLIDNLFLFSRLELNKYPFAPIKLPLSQWLIKIIGDLSVDYPGIAFRTGLIEEALVMADPEELFRVIYNIVQNSNKYACSNNTIITFSMTVITNHAQIVIEDNGPGVDEKQIPFIFEHFYQTDKSRSKKSESCGLGLSIARMIISQHNGSIYAESPIGRGLSIFIKIPLLG